MKNRRGAATAVVVMALIPVLGLVAGGFWLYDDIAVSAGRMERLVEGARASGVPVTAEDWEGPGPVKAGSDAAKVLKGLQAKWEGLGPERQRSIQQTYRNMAVGSVKTKSHEADRADGEALVSMARKAAGFADAGLTRDWLTQGEYNDLHIAALQAARLVCANAQVKARGGQFGAAFSDLNVARRLGKHLSRRDALDGLKAHLMLENMALTAATQILAEHGGRSECRGQYQQFLTKNPSFPDVVKSLEAEALHANTVFSSPESFPDGIYAGVRLEVQGLILQKANAARMLEFWTMALPAIREGAPDLLEVRDAYHFAVEDYLLTRSPSRVLCQSAVQRHQKTLEAANALAVQYELGSVFLKLVSLKASSGAWPESLRAAKVSAKDPCSDESFGFAKSEDGVVVWSVGSDRVDDGGDGGSDGMVGRDVVLRVEKGVVSLSGM